MPPSTRPGRSFITAAVVLALVIALVWFARGRIHFDWHALFRQLRSVSVGYVLAGVAVIYAGLGLRSLRWALLVNPVRRTRATELYGSQLMGFTAIVLFGRLADLVRPYLIARRLSLPVASQLAVYSIERAFDLGAAAVLFSLTLAVAPRSTPHHEAYVRAGALALAATLGIAMFVLALRFAGERVAATFRKLLQPLSATLAVRAQERVLDFRQGLRTLTSLREFLAVAALSVAMWASIAWAYMLSAHAFVRDPVLAHFSVTATMLLLATSLGGSLIQLPVLGWFTQMAVVGASLAAFFGVQLETATACGAVVFFVVNLDVVPGGLIAARLGGTTLRQAMDQSSTAEAGAAELS